MQLKVKKIKEEIMFQLVSNVYGVWGGRSHIYCYQKDRDFMRTSDFDGVEDDNTDFGKFSLPSAFSHLTIVSHHQNKLVIPWNHVNLFLKTDLMKMTGYSLVTFYRSTESMQDFQSRLLYQVHLLLINLACKNSTPLTTRKPWQLRTQKVTQPSQCLLHKNN